jgi:alpha-glucosidase
LITGRYQLLLENDAHIYAYQRIESDLTWTVITNLSDHETKVDLDVAQLGELVLDNQTPNNNNTRSDFMATQLAPAYAAYVFVKKQ